MTIDWDKPLECEHGPLMVIAREEDESLNVRTMDGLTTWWVYKDGVPMNRWMPRVYNAKRKPEEGEWWMCREKVGAVLTERPYCLRNGRWRVSSMGLAYFPIDSVEPLYLLIKDPSFED